VKLEHLLSISGVARFLGTPEGKVNELLEDGRLGGALVAAFRSRGVAVTPSLKNSIEGVVAALNPKTGVETAHLDRAYLLTSEATATIMFTDIVGSTAMVERLGDRRARDVFRAHNEIVRRSTRVNGGAEVKNMGDGFMLTFSSARRGVGCAVAVQRELRKLDSDNPETSLAVRMGLSVGEPIREEDDLFGKSVVLDCGAK
jgi:class 3 adenylate cyclase